MKIVSVVLLLIPLTICLHCGQSSSDGGDKENQGTESSSSPTPSPSPDVDIPPVTHEYLGLYRKNSVSNYGDAYLIQINEDGSLTRIFRSSGINPKQMLLAPASRSLYINNELNFEIDSYYVDVAKNKVNWVGSSNVLDGGSKANIKVLRLINNGASVEFYFESIFNTAFIWKIALFGIQTNGSLSYDSTTVTGNPTTNPPYAGYNSNQVFGSSGTNSLVRCPSGKYQFISSANSQNVTVQLIATGATVGSYSILTAPSSGQISVVGTYCVSMTSK